VNGLLAERRIVEMPAKKIQLSEVYGTDGVVMIVDGDGKEVATVKGTLSAATAPDLPVDTTKFPLLPLPHRVPDHVRKALKPENQALEPPRLDDALRLVAAHFGQRKGDEAMKGFRQSLHDLNQRQLGFCILLGALGQCRDSDHRDVLRERLN